MELVTEKVFRENNRNEQSMINPLRWENMEPFGIDLTVGEHCTNVTMGATIRLGEGERLEVRPGDFVIIDTDEHLDVLASHFGLLFPKVSLTLKRLSQSGGKVNPGYSGYLKVALKNEGHQSVWLKRGERICNVAFWFIQ